LRPHLGFLAENWCALVEGDYFLSILAFLLSGRFANRVWLLEILVNVSEFMKHFLIEWLWYYLLAFVIIIC
jgi:hypothetical protein